ncbi:MAG: hypothetical protein GX791_06335 [Synergistaceae bacterium]|nr:hypothetical protein [Synergistaceae bacterium]
MVQSISKKFFAMLLVLSLIICACGIASAAGAQMGFSSANLKKMSTFLSNFTELGFMNFDAKELTDEANPADMIRFGIWHNYINNFKSRISQCKTKDCKWGSLIIEGKYVTETIKKYFDVDYKKLASVTESDPPYFFDGKLYHFEGADGEAVYYARVYEAEKNAEGHIIMRGEIYNADDEKDILATFEALAKPHKFAGKDTWAIISMETESNDVEMEEEGAPDKAVEGLWIEVSTFPAEGEIRGFEMNDEGVASYTRTLDEGNIALVVERFPMENNGKPVTPDTIGALVAEFEGIAEDKVEVTPSVEKYTKMYFYPVAGAKFLTGENEDKRKNVDLFIFTDQWLFRIHVSMMADAAEQYEEQVMDWFSNLKMRE